MVKNEGFERSLMNKDQTTKWQVDTLWWVITGHCNLKCKHCYIESPQKKYNQLSFKECINIIDQASDAGIKNIFISGGEPFIREDFLKIIDEIYKREMKITGIESNATLLNPEIIDQIHDKSICWHISHDGINSHEKLRGVIGTEEKTFKKIKMLIDYGFKVSINTTLSAINKHEMLETYELLKKLSICSWQIFPMTNIGNWKHANNKELTWQEEGECYVKIFKEWLNDNKPFSLSLGSVFTHKRNPNGSFPKTKYICEYMRSSITLLPDGILVPCCRYISHTETMDKMKNALQDPIKEQIKNSELKKIKNTTIGDALQKNSSCKKCHLIDACQLGCRINAYLNTGDIFNKEEKNCVLMRNYYEKYFKEHDFKK